MFAEVAVNSGAPHRQLFTYAVPPGMRVRVGHAVYVPFGNRLVQGLVLRLTASTDVEGIRPITRLAAPEPLVDEARAELAIWLAREYMAPAFAAAATVAPPGFGETARTVVTVVPDAPRGVRVAPKAREAYGALVAAGGELELAELATATGRRSASTIVAALEKAGLVRKVTLLRPPRVRSKLERHLRATGRLEPQNMAPRPAEALGWLRTNGPQPAKGVRKRFTSPVVRRLLDLELVEEYGIAVERDPLATMEVEPRSGSPLTEAQTRAVEQILGARGEWFLLHGVTGSGKTEVYLAALEAVVARGGRGIVLVPDISLTPQIVRRFAERFPGRVAVLHSALSPGERFDQWHAIRDGRFGVVIGPRGALFAPMPDLRLIVIDEEHEWTYKQDQLQPRYDARAAARELARLTGATLVFGSATPDVVTYFEASRADGDGRVVELPDRVAVRDGAVATVAPPVVEVVNLRSELLSGNRSIFSRELTASLRDALDAGEQAILFLNRRGSATQLFCRDCGLAPQCRACLVPFTVHEYEGKLICHWCGARRQIPLLCPNCRGPRLKPVGTGTQRVELEVMKQFPPARVLRWDRDVTRRKGDHERILREFASGGADVLVGTQMVAKGLDLPNVTLVGVILADISLNVNDYRSSERTFQLLTQVSGRAGRREQQGRVVIQTYQPAHPAVAHAAATDYESFYAEEIAVRSRSGYPPFGRLAHLLYQNSRRPEADGEAVRMARELRERIRRLGLPGADVRGPTPAFVERLRGRYRRSIVVRAPDPVALLDGVAFGDGWAVDIDPASLS